MPLLVLVAVAVVAVLLARQTGALKPCRWRPVGFRSSASNTRWVCAACGQEVFSTDGKPPRLCKRHLRKPTL